MKLRMQLILAFFLLAVVPLAGVSIYSYNSSLRAFRRAVEAESGTLAAQMGERMESVRNDLNRRVQRLGVFPFQTLMGAEGRKTGTTGQAEASDKDALMNQLMVQMGDSAAFIRALEFTPATPAIPAERRPAAGGPKPPRHPGPPPGTPEPDMMGLVIHMPGDSGGNGAGGHNRDLPGSAGQHMIHIETYNVPAAPPVPPQPPSDPEMIRHIKTEALQNVEQQAQALKEAAVASRQAGEAVKAITAAKQHLELSMGRDFAAEVRREGELLGEVKAQVSTNQILRHILSRTQRKQGGIPFAMDPAGKLYAADPADLPKIETLPLARGGKATPDSDPADRNWVIVTRKDAASGMTFGVAQPVGEGLEEIRRTAVRNLLYGMGMVGVALIGILPLSGRMTRNLTLLTHGAEQLAHGELRTRVPIRSKDEIGQLARAFNRMAEELSEKQKHLLEKERMRKELEMCRKIQEELLPRQTLRTGFVEVKGVSIPAREVGGDFFNYFPLPNGDLAMLVGDVSGKGLPAALLMANLQATIQARLPLELDLAKLADQLDHQIGAATPPEVFLTLFIAILETESRKLHYVNAGHNPQFVLGVDGTVTRLESTGRPLGLLPGGGYQNDHLQLHDGDSVFFYTDGLVEAENSEGQEFGMERLEKLVLEARSAGLEGMLARVEKVTNEYRGTLEAADDATMVLVKVGKPT